jgi:hypothetical protein
MVWRRGLLGTLPVAVRHREALLRLITNIIGNELREYTESESRISPASPSPVLPEAPSPPQDLFQV